MGESQRAERTRTFLKAVIEYNHGAAQVDCVVKNISATGARLDVPPSVSLPNTFSLRIPHRDESNRCRLIWREKDVIGVRFVEQRKIAPKAEPVRELNEIESENARLRRRVRELTLRLEALGQDPLTDERP